MSRERREGRESFCQSWSLQKACHRLGFTGRVTFRCVARKEKVVLDQDSGGNKLCELGRARETGV